MRGSIAVLAAGCAVVLLMGNARAEDALGFNWTSGVRIGAGSGSTEFKWKDDAGAVTETEDWTGVTGVVGETFFRGDHTGGLFIKGVLGGGNLNGGDAHDNVPAGSSWSDFETFSTQRDGNLDYFSGDVGYSIWKTDNGKLGGYVGYGRQKQVLNAFGCVQTFAFETCDPSLPNEGEAYSQQFQWSAWRIGMAAELQLTPQLSLEAEATYLAGVSVTGKDYYGVEPGGEIPVALNGNGGNGYELLGAMNYRVSDALSIGFGGRYSKLNEIETIFHNEVLGGVAEASSVESERFALFGQASVKLDEAFAGGALKDGASPAIAGWEGSYSELFVGKGQGDNAVEFGGDPVTQFLIENDVFAGRLDVRRRGMIAGLGAGYNWMWSSMLLGVEGDAAWSGVVGSSSRTTDFPFFFNTTTEQAIDWVATLRGRAGVLATENLLIYGTGGLAAGRTRLDIALTNTVVGCPDQCLSENSAGVSLGYALGAGYEYALAPGLRWKTDYLFTDLGTRTTTIVNPNDPTLFYEGTASFQTHMVRSGIVVSF